MPWEAVNHTRGLFGWKQQTQHKAWRGDISPGGLQLTRFHYSNANLAAEMARAGFPSRRSFCFTQEVDYRKDVDVPSFISGILQQERAWGVVCQQSLPNRLGRFDTGGQVTQASGKLFLPLSLSNLSWSAYLFRSLTGHPSSGKVTCRVPQAGTACGSSSWHLPRSSHSRVDILPSFLVPKLHVLVIHEQGTQKTTQKPRGNRVDSIHLVWWSVFSLNPGLRTELSRSEGLMVNEHSNHLVDLWNFSSLGFSQTSGCRLSESVWCRD